MTSPSQNACNKQKTSNQPSNNQLYHIDGISNYQEQTIKEYCATLISKSINWLFEVTDIGSL